MKRKSIEGFSDYDGQFLRVKNEIKCRKFWRKENRKDNQKRAKDLLCKFIFDFWYLSYGEQK